MSLVLGVDLGSTYFKLGLFDHSGALRGLGRVATAPATRITGRCELTVEDFWNKIKQTLFEALMQAEAGAADIVGVSYATQANTFLLLDGEKRPLTPLIFWPDRRAIELGDEPDGLGGLDRFQEISGVGVGLAPVFAVAKLRWFQRCQPKVWARTRHVLTISDYLTWSLTGQMAGDAGSAALLGLIDARQGVWRPEALEACGLAAEQMVHLQASGSVVGRTTGPAAGILGLRTVPFTVGSMDHHVAALGAGVGPLGDCSESTGTVVACAAPCQAYTPTKGVCLAPGIGPGYYAMTFDDNGAAALDWYRRTFTPELGFEELVRLAGAVPAGCEGVRALPGPHHYPGREGFTGRHPRHGHGHYVRAILESVADSLARCVATLPADRPIRRILATGGGAKSDLWLRIKADRLGTTLVRPNCPEPACRGAAMIAAAAAGWFQNFNEARAAWARSEITINPTNQGIRKGETR